MNQNINSIKELRYNKHKSGANDPVIIDPRTTPEVYWSLRLRLCNTPKIFILHLITKAKIEVPIDKILIRAARFGTFKTVFVGVENT